MQPEHVVILVLAAVAVVALVAAIARFRSNLANAKREWLSLSTLLTGYSMPHLAKVLECLAVEDLPGALAECKYLLRQFSDPKSAAIVLDNVLIGELPGALSDATRITAVAKAISAWIAANPALATAAGLAAVSPK
jgi:hypothetical protein